MDEKIANEIILSEHGENSSSLSKHLRDHNDENSFLIKEINAPIIKAVEFCCNILSRNGLGTYIHIDRFQSYRDIAANEIKFIVNSKKHLMELLCTFPLLFHVVGNEVTLRNWVVFHLNQQKWLKELVPNSFHLVPIFTSAVQFYCNELFKITPMFELPLCQLFSCKSKAPEAIQAVTRNIKELLMFLKLYPEIFCLSGDKVFLSVPALSYRSVETWIKILLDADFTLEKDVGMKDYEVLKDEVVAHEAVGLHYKFIWHDGSIKGMTLKKLIRKYNTTVPMSTLIKSVVDLEYFVSSYPDVFILNNKKVFLTHFYPNITHTEFTSIKEDQLNCSLSKDGLNKKNNVQTVISFYLNLLNNLSNLPGKIDEFPINHLLYYNVIAPSEVKRIAQNQLQLKKFLLKYPQMFKINNDNIIVIDSTNVSLDTNEKLPPTSAIDSNMTDKRKSEEAVGFYTKVIYELGGPVTIKQLLDCRWQASEEVQSIASSFEEVKNFLSIQQNNFTVVNDRVYLKNKKKEDDFEVNTLTFFSKQNATENAISFYSNVLRNHKNQTVSLNRLTGHRGSAPSDVQSVAKNPKELKTFFSQFPEAFTIVDDNKVMLSKPPLKLLTTQEQKHTFPPKKLYNASENDTVEFFLKMLNHYGICGVISINKLFELKLQSSPSVQKISGSNIKQFLDFLLKYPQEFLVTNDNVIARKKIPKWSYGGKYENKKFTDPLLLLIFNFFKIYTSNKSIFHIDYLFNNVGRFFVYIDETPVFPSKSDLLLFLGLYPHVFFVDYYRIVNVIASSRKAFMSDSKRRQFRFKNINISRSKKNETPKPSFANLKSPQNLSPLSATSIDNESKPSIAEIKENISSQTETSKKDFVRSITPVQPKKRLAFKARNRRKANISTDILPLVESSVSEESLVSELSKNYDEEKEAEFDSSNCLELEDHFWNNQYSPCWSNEVEGEFNPPTIEEIENNIFSNFIGHVNKNYHLITNNEVLTPSHTEEIFNLNFPTDFSERDKLDRLIKEVLLFLNDKLWEGGNLNIIKIEDLYNTFSKSGLELSNCYCNNLEEFIVFLAKFPDHFIVSQKHVMARKNKILNTSYFLKNEEESLPLIVFHFLNLYTKHFNFILLRLLYSQVGKCFCNINRSPFFKTLGDLVVFLEMFPEVFSIESNQIRNLTAPKENVFHKVTFNSGVIKINSFLDKTYSTIANEKFLNVPESTEGWKEYVLERTQIIEDLSQCRVVTADILNSHKVIALDCEGVSLGAAGRLTLVQIGLANGQVYIFDIIKDPSVVNDGGLKDILESESIIKVIHDSKNDVANLYTEYGVKITHIFDTRVAHYLIVNQAISPKRIPRQLPPIGFNELCSKYGANLNVQKDEMKNVYKCNPNYWMTRPLTKDMVAYAALDVASLVPQIFFTMLKQLKGIPEKYLWELSGKHSLSALNNKDLLFD